MLTLRQLRYLDALSRHRHFGRAAEECAVSQPALSMQIQELEDCLGGALVERLNGNARLTERGVQIAERAALILSATRDLVEFAHRTGRLLVGTLRLGIIPTLAPYLLPRVIPELQRCYPELRLGLLEAQTKTLLNELTRGTIDVALLTLPVEKTDIETLQLFEDRFLLAVSAKDPLPERARVTVSDVEQRQLLLLEEGHCLRDQALAYCRDARNGPNNSFFATSLSTIIQMVASGYGVTLLPEVAVNVELRDSRVKLLRFSDPQPSRSVGLLWRKTSPCSEDFHALGQVVLTAASPALALYQGGRARRASCANPSADVQA
ncbi:LysR family transcriptional regulator [Methylobacterium planeticum]|uniref:LysR family transcriptional regulator n=2 Tax=Methylobacterium planeticum TaxID=2615211 RepID=A0A6N6MQ11_9HYPH|nr:LysR family transcriptional regulator [Methylobacterium planeticum]